jgi:hypothetical protein
LDVSQRFLGPRTTLAWEEEVRAAHARTHARMQATAPVLLLPDTPGTKTNKVSLASVLLYYGLTTGAGTPTLGEEYCDLHLARGERGALCERQPNHQRLTRTHTQQVTGAAQRPVSSTQRLLLVTLQSVVPYLFRREQCVTCPCAWPTCGVVDRQGTYTGLPLNAPQAFSRTSRSRRGDKRRAAPPG